MVINKMFKLHKVCAKPGSSRYALTSAYLDKAGDSPVMVATNGSILAVVPVSEADNDVSRPIPADAVKEAVSGGGRFGQIESNGSIRARRMNGSPQCAEFPADDDLKFPDWRMCVPDANDGQWIEFGINVKMLHALADAIGSDGKIRIRAKLDPKRGQRNARGQIIPDITGATLVDAIDGIAGAYGVAMPVSPSDEHANY